MNFKFIVLILIFSNIALAQNIQFNEYYGNPAGNAGMVTQSSSNNLLSGNAGMVGLNVTEACYMKPLSDSEKQAITSLSNCKWMHASELSIKCEGNRPQKVCRGVALCDMFGASITVDTTCACQGLDLKDATTCVRNTELQSSSNSKCGYGYLSTNSAEPGIAQPNTNEGVR